MCFSLCNNDGQTAEDIALAAGFLECAKFLTTIKHTRNMKLREQSGYSFSDNCRLPREAPAGQKRESGINGPINRKRRRLNGMYLMALSTLNIKTPWARINPSLYLHALPNFCNRYIVVVVMVRPFPVRLHKDDLGSVEKINDLRRYFPQKIKMVT